MTKENFYDIINNISIIDIDEKYKKEINSIIESYPYFQTARFLSLKFYEKGTDEYLKQLQETSLYITNKNNSLFKQQNLESEKTNINSTESLINSFLETINKPQIDNIEDIQMSSIDYVFNKNSQENNKEELANKDIIDNFLHKVELKGISISDNKTIDTDHTINDQLDTSLLTETLANIYIKQNKYEEAIRIIKHLNLNITKKSVYFAHQIKFLEYLIINENKKK